MLSEYEVRSIKENTMQQLEDIVDPVERKIAGAFIAGLECALND